MSTAMIWLPLLPFQAVEMLHRKDTVSHCTIADFGNKMAFRQTPDSKSWSQKYRKLCWVETQLRLTRKQKDVSFGCLGASLSPELDVLSPELDIPSPELGNEASSSTSSDGEGAVPTKPVQATKICTVAGRSMNSDQAYSYLDFLNWTAGTMRRALARITQHDIIAGNPERDTTSDVIWNRQTLASKHPDPEHLAIVEAKQCIASNHISLAETWRYEMAKEWPYGDHKLLWMQFYSWMWVILEQRHLFARSFNVKPEVSERAIFQTVFNQYSAILPIAEELIVTLEEALSNEANWSTLGEAVFAAQVPEEVNDDAAGEINDDTAAESSDKAAEDPWYIPPVPEPEPEPHEDESQEDEPQEDTPPTEAEAFQFQESYGEAPKEPEKPDRLDSVLKFVFKAKRIRGYAWALKDRIDKLSCGWPEDDPWIKEFYTLWNNGPADKVSEQDVQVRAVGGSNNGSEKNEGERATPVETVECGAEEQESAHRWETMVSDSFHYMFIY
jgi:hypothetical protein